MTTTGIHELLAAAPPASESLPPAKRAFPISAEFRRQWLRRRTRGTLILLALLPVALIVAFLVGEGAPPGAGGSLLDNASVGAVNFTLFVMFVSCTFLVAVVAALVGGDTVSSEASWSTLRYLLAAPIGRARLLAVKWVVTCVSVAVALGVLFGSALAFSTWAFGMAAVKTPAGGVIEIGDSLTRLGIAIAYILITAITVAALAFLLGVWTDTPLGAVGGAVLLMIVSSILDQIEDLGIVRQILPTHYQFAWTDALLPDILWDTMARGAALSLGYTALFLVASWWHFTRKDIVS